MAASTVQRATHKIAIKSWDQNGIEPHLLQGKFLEYFFEEANHETLISLIGSVAGAGCNSTKKAKKKGKYMPLCVMGCQGVFRTDVGSHQKNVQMVANLLHERFVKQGSNTATVLRPRFGKATEINTGVSLHKQRRTNRKARVSLLTRKTRFQYTGCLLAQATKQKQIRIEVHGQVLLRSNKSQTGRRTLTHSIKKSTLQSVSCL